jgi:hypothetical protein
LFILRCINAMMKKLCLCGWLCLLLYSAHAQRAGAAHAVNKTDTARSAPDSVFVPLKYCNTHRRSPVLACFLSLCIPGLGQVYNKQALKGGILLGTFAVSFGASQIYYANNKTHPHDGVTIALLLPMAAAFGYSIIDAPVTASWLNRTYRLSKKKRGLTTLYVEPGLISMSPDHYTAGLSLVLR